MSETATVTRKKRVHKHLNYRLAWVQETASDIGPNGEEIPGRPCLVLMGLPPGLTEKQATSRTAIKRAVKKAVYEDKMKEYGNKQLVIVSFDDTFTVPFEEVTETKLVPPLVPAAGLGRAILGASAISATPPARTPDDSHDTK